MSHFEAEIARLGPWFHNLHLPDGSQTCPDHRLGDFPHFKWERLKHHIPLDLRGTTVLDIGCNAGFYSLELAKRGASVTALDVDAHYLDQARWAAAVWGLTDRIQFQRAQVYSLARSTRRWDLVLFLGVLYHLRYPMLGLDIVSRCTDKTLILQSLSMPGETSEVTPPDLELSNREPLTRIGWPKLSFVERSLAADQTNWWVPNQPCVEAMVRSTGLRVVSRPLDEFYVCEPDPSNASNMWSWNEAEFWAAVGGKGEVQQPGDEHESSAPPVQQVL